VITPEQDHMTGRVTIEVWPPRANEAERDVIIRAVQWAAWKAGRKARKRAKVRRGSGFTKEGSRDAAYVVTFLTPKGRRAYEIPVPNWPDLRGVFKAESIAT
jgi:hypothetical protein